MIALISSIRVAPADAETLEREFAGIAGHVRVTEPGTLVYHLARRAEAGAYRVVEIYRDEEAIGIHLGSDAFKSFRPKLGAMLLEPPEVEKMEVAV